MPPARELTFKVNEPAVRELEQRIGVGEHIIRVKQLRDGSKTTHGEYRHAQREITMFLGPDLLVHSPLRFANRLAISTLLHEYRHAWQYVNWPIEEIHADMRLPYALQKGEIDANEWAAAWTTTWLRLGKVVGKSSSVFGAQNRKLSALGVGR